MHDKTVHTKTGLKVEVAADFEVTDAAHKHLHLQQVDAEFTRLLGDALSNPSSVVACAALRLTEEILREAGRLARMDEKEFGTEFGSGISRIAIAFFERGWEENNGRNGNHPFSAN